MSPQRLVGLPHPPGVWPVEPNAPPGFLDPQHANDWRVLGMKSKEVLIIGPRLKGTTRIVEHIVRRGCRLFFAENCESTRLVLKERRADLVLSQLVLSDGTADQILTLLEGASANAFCANSLEESAWWLHVLVDGKNHWWKPRLLSPEEFSTLFDAQLLKARCAFDADSKKWPQRDRCSLVVRPPSGCTGTG